MNNLPLQPLVWDWSYGDGGKTSAVCRAKSLSHEYIVRLEQCGYCYVDYRKFDNDEDSDNRKDEPPEFNSVKEAQYWVDNTHYPHTMQPYVKQDSTQRIENWFKAAKPEPTDKDICTQIGCHFEEIDENIESLNCEDWSDAYRLSKIFKGVDGSEAADYVRDFDKIELLDSLCDQIVTAIGVGYMMGFDIQGALNEVIRSNDSKKVGGKFEFDDNGKIMKPTSFSEPDLTPFVGD